MYGDLLPQADTELLLGSLQLYQPVVLTPSLFYHILATGGAHGCKGFGESPVGTFTYLD